MKKTITFETDELQKSSIGQPRDVQFFMGVTINIVQNVIKSQDTINVTNVVNNVIHL